MTPSTQVPSATIPSMVLVNSPYKINQCSLGPLKMGSVESLVKLSMRMGHCTLVKCGKLGKLFNVCREFIRNGVGFMRVVNGDCYEGEFADD